MIAPLETTPGRDEMVLETYLGTWTKVACRLGCFALGTAQRKQRIQCSAASPMHKKIKKINKKTSWVWGDIIPFSETKTREERKYYRTCRNANRSTLGTLIAMRVVALDLCTPTPFHVVPANIASPCVTDLAKICLTADRAWANSRGIQQL